MQLERAFLAMILMALVTYIPRVLPIVIFRKEIKSKYIKSFLQYVPFAVLSSLTFPDIFSSTGNLTSAICGTLVALWLSYREKSLVVVAISAIVTVYLTGLFL
ncbi:MAG TPA: AzlD domain-containing protein [Clostridiales bacterium]|jgi:branched-subunit amino acid transport protein|nr:AzlD domain-containing protein [Clostridiales bacterium]